MKRKLLVTLVLVLLLATLSFATAAANGEDAMVYVGHGIPGEALSLDPALPVDVLVDDTICLLEGFEFGEFEGPFDLAGRTYNIKISLASADPDADPPVPPCANAAVINTDVPVMDGVNYTVFAHLTATGVPTATAFENDVSAIVPGKARLTVRHTAAAPAVDVTLNRGWGRGRPVGPMDARPITGLENPDEADPLDIRPGAYQASIFPAGEAGPVADPIKVVLNPFKSYIVYAVGDLNGGSFTVLTQVIEGLDKVMPPRPNPPKP